MNCLFCDQELSDSTKWWDDEGSTVFESYTCKPCSAHFTVLEVIGQVTDYYFDFKEYRLDFDVANTKFELYKRIPQHRIDDCITLYDVKKVLALATLPSITPQNAEDKIKTLITFS